VYRCFLARAKFKKNLTKGNVAENLKDIEDDMKGQVRYQCIYWTFGRHDTVVLFEAQIRLFMRMLSDPTIKSLGE